MFLIPEYDKKKSISKNNTTFVINRCLEHNESCWLYILKDLKTEYLYNLHYICNIKEAKNIY